MSGQPAQIPGELTRQLYLTDIKMLKALGDDLAPRIVSTDKDKYSINMEYLTGFSSMSQILKDDVSDDGRFVLTHSQRCC